MLRSALPFCASKSEQSRAEHRQALARRSPIARKAERRDALYVDQGGGVEWRPLTPLAGRRQRPVHFNRLREKDRSSSHVTC
jgi:hypothetical protein